MASFWEKTKKAAAEAADATARGTQRTKLAADISLLGRKQRQAKEAFGAAVWDLWGTPVSVLDFVLCWRSKLFWADGLLLSSLFAWPRLAPSARP